MRSTSTARRHTLRFARMDSKRRATAAVLVAVVIPVLIGFAALTIDVSAMYTVRNELQLSADAAAMAAASAYLSNPMLQVRLGYGGEAQVDETMYLGRTEVTRVAAQNHSLQLSHTDINASDVAFGWIDIASGTSPLNPAAAGNTFNAARVMVRRDDQANGPMSLYFASIFGRSSTAVTASAVAALDDRFSGYETSDGTAALWPIAVHEDIYNDQIINGGDTFEYDPVTGVARNADGIHEINLYPYVNTPGNFGMLQIGHDTSSADTQSTQLEYGVSPDEVQTEIGSTEFSFYNDGGEPVTYNINGSPGLMTTLEGPIETHVGDVVGFLLFDNAIEQGALTEYHITRMVFARVMGVMLQGAAHKRGVWLQPAPYAGGGVRTDPDAPSSNGMVGKLILVR